MKSTSMRVAVEKRGGGVAVEKAGAARKTRVAVEPLALRKIPCGYAVFPRRLCMVLLTGDRTGASIYHSLQTKPPTA
jgi:hypothetical protein